ncbi:Hypothetical protein SRAE_X000107700 [Strongyloides ratti]|uniref:Uncharacterized protein n=1 Tax=Strongyloides ratti TaxID=34506 RepID=A0A090KVQ6_STRRB|nr:Hypothetical protein SRAE_X000107700 [Strongyloides ratti]CEF59327.1 Hypothetical protein SRAE_X000107700 [Strongyloides ratti]
MASNEILSMVFGEPMKEKEEIERKIETITSNNSESYIEKRITSKVITSSSHDHELLERLSEHNHIEKRAMYNVNDGRNHHHENHIHHEKHFDKSHNDNHQNKTKNVNHYHEYTQNNKHTTQNFEETQPKMYHKARTESLLSSVSSSLVGSIIDNGKHYQNIDQFSDRTLTDGERTPIIEDFKSVKSETTMIPRGFVERDLKSPSSTRPSTVIGGYSNGQSHQIRDIVNQERIKELTEQLREELHFRNSYVTAYSEMSIENELEHLPDEPEEDSVSIASEIMENITSGRHSAHFLNHSTRHSVDPLNIKLKTPMSTRQSSIISVIKHEPKKFEVKEYSLKKPIEPTPNPNPLTPYTLKPKVYNGVQERIQKKKSVLPKSPNPTPRESVISSHYDNIHKNKITNNHMEKKDILVNRMDSIRVSKGNSKNDKNYDFNIKNDKTLICCNCGCHHVFTSGIPNLRFSIIKRVVGTESRRGSVIYPSNRTKKLSTNEKKYFNIATN